MAYRLNKVYRDSKWLFGVVCLFVHCTAYTGPGTTMNLQEIIIGRCWDFQNVQFPLPEIDRVNCTELWETFYTAVAHKDPCNVTKEDYGKMMALLPDVTVANKSLFWEGVYDMVQDYTNFGRRLVSIADTLTGYVADKLFWCGSPGGLNYTNCPTKLECGPLGTQYFESFWGAASAKFAEDVKGAVRVFMNGTRGNRPAFEKGSFFAKYELPNLNKSRVNFIRVIVIIGIDTENKVENCSSGSIPNLLDIIAASGIRYDCVNLPSNVRHFLCIDDPTAPECQFAEPKTPTALTLPVTSESSSCSSFTCSCLALIGVVCASLFLKF